MSGALSGGDLFLAFPQWQGAGLRRAMGASSGTLPRWFPGRDWRRVPVRRASPARIARGIRGRATCVAQLDRALHVIRARDPARIYTLGGDCSVELGPVATLARRLGGRLTVVWLDAHPDLSTPATSRSHTLHGMVLMTLFGDGDPAITRRLPARLAPRQVVLAGVRDLDPHERGLIRRLRLRSVGCAALRRDPDALAGAVARAGHRHVYVHLDLDVLDPRWFASIAFPTPGGGLTPDAVAAALSRLRRRFEIVGCGITEYVARRRSDVPALVRMVNRLLP